MGHRFSNGIVSIDVLAPDGIGERASLTTITPARTIRVPAGTQALRRTEMVDVLVDGDHSHLPRPNLLGAILLKARAVAVDDAPRSQLLDLAFLLSLVASPSDMHRELARSERSWLRSRQELLDRNAQPWRLLEQEDADNGFLALQILIS